jgi:hypothetical protein
MGVVAISFFCVTLSFSVDSQTEELFVGWSSTRASATEGFGVSALLPLL